jgi:hypothetical protein
VFLASLGVHRKITGGFFAKRLSGLALARLLLPLAVVGND